MTDLTKEADDFIARLRAIRPGKSARKYVYVTRHVDLADADLESAAASIEAAIEKVSHSLEEVSAPLRVLDLIITPMAVSERHYGRDAMGEYDNVETQRGVILTFKLG